MAASSVWVGTPHEHLGFFSASSLKINHRYYFWKKPGHIQPRLQADNDERSPEDTANWKSENLQENKFKNGQKESVPAISSF